MRGNTPERWFLIALTATLLLLIAILFAAIMARIIKAFWNYLMPDLFGLHPINLMQASGIFMLIWMILCTSYILYKRRK